MQPKHAGEERDSQRDLPGAELRNFKACTAGENGGEGQARGLCRKLLPEPVTRAAPFAINRHHTVHRRDGQRPEHDQCGEVTVYQQVRDAPKGYAAEARVTRDPRDAIDRELVVDHPGRASLPKPLIACYCRVSDSVLGPRYVKFILHPMLLALEI